MVIKPITAQVAAPTSTGAASDVSSSVIVRCVNSGSTARLITLEEAGGTDKGTFTLEANGSIYIKNVVIQAYPINHAHNPPSTL